MVQGLTLAGHGQWGFPWAPADLVRDDGHDLGPGPGELSWAEFESELHALLAQEAPRTGDGPRPSSGPLA
ncbi:hypothetical protein AB2L27_11030 [Kineococcus sp. LSe6-4]|uniref:Uncharacterized protein n=1 Tax=Kineococcus halophytocola TaxID=3234027 RepID=A0ABV4H493_9ACTN